MELLVFLRVVLEKVCGYDTVKVRHDVVVCMDSVDSKHLLFLVLKYANFLIFIFWGCGGLNLRQLLKFIFGWDSA